MKNYNEGQVVSMLNKHKNVSITNKTVYITGNVGKNTWGKIDYLTNHCGYVQSSKEKSF